MRVPTNSFDSTDLKLCREHSIALWHGPMTAYERHDDAEWSRQWDRAEAIATFETAVCMPDDLPLPPSYWDDLEHWLKTLAPAKPAATGDAYISAKQPEPAADVWHSEAPSVAGLYVASAMCDEGSVRWFDGSDWHEAQNHCDRDKCRSRPKTSAQSVQWLRLIEADAPATKREIVDASLARLASTSSADGAALVGANP